MCHVGDLCLWRKRLKWKESQSISTFFYVAVRGEANLSGFIVSNVFLQFFIIVYLVCFSVSSVFIVFSPLK